MLSCEKVQYDTSVYQPPAPTIDTTDYIQLSNHTGRYAPPGLSNIIFYDSSKLRQNWKVSESFYTSSYHAVSFVYTGTVPLLLLDSIKRVDGKLVYYAPDASLIGKPVFKAYDYDVDSALVKTYILAPGSQIAVICDTRVDSRAFDSTLTAYYNSYLTGLDKSIMFYQ
jgi:hypothetical protein